MLQFSSPRLTASHKVAGSTSKVGKRVVGIVDPPKGSATIGFILAQLFGGFGAGPPNRDEPALNERAPAEADAATTVWDPVGLLCQVGYQQREHEYRDHISEP
jgi:hypothetical protein